METKKAKKANIEGLRGIFFECGLIVGLFFMIVAFSWSSDGEAKTILQSSIMDIPDDIDMVNTIPDEPPTPPEVAPPVIADELQIVENTMDITGVSLFNSEDNKTPVFETVYVKPKEVEKEVVFLDDINVEVVQEKPQFMGGDANDFSKWVASKVVYPTIDQENGVQGKVILQFRIAPDGTLGNIKVLRSISPGLDKEAVRVVSLSPPWKAGKQNGKPVGVLYTFPVNFVLQNN